MLTGPNINVWSQTRTVLTCSKFAFKVVDQYARSVQS